MMRLGESFKKQDYCGLLTQFYMFLVGLLLAGRAGAYPTATPAVVNGTATASQNVEWLPDVTDFDGILGLNSSDLVTTIALNNLVTVGTLDFNTCTALTNLSVPLVTSIGANSLAYSRRLTRAPPLRCVSPATM